VHDLEYLQLLQLLQLLDHLNDMDHLMLVHLFRCVVEIANLDQMYQQDVEKMDVLQIPDEQNLDEVLTFQDVVRHFLVNHLVNLANLADVEGGELCHLLKMDYYQDEVGVELHYL
jgi:predicted amino acid racemase